METEKQVEIYLKREIEKRKGVCIKFISPSMAGVPDRIVLLPQHPVYFVELKRPGGKLRPLQKAVHRKFKSLGQGVHVLDSIESVGRWIDGL